MGMPLYLGIWDILVRLLLAALAGALLGFDRGQRGHAAGLRTTILVSLAAAIAMEQANALLPVGGKASDSFSVMDVARFPLGILTGVGFIGGGTILKRGDLVTGVTTAATLWIATVIGLCFGGGQWMLGLAGTALGSFTLLGLRRLDNLIPRRRKARATLIASERKSIPAAEVAGVVGCHAVLLAENRDGDRSLLRYELDWSSSDDQSAEKKSALLGGSFDVAAFEVQSESNH